MRMKKRDVEKFNRVKTSIEFDVKETIIKKLENVISEVVDECSREFHRNIDVLFSVEMD